jgi:hypothetical protein
METKDALDLLIKVSETTGKSWNRYYFVVFAILGFVATNSEVVKNMKLRVLIMFLFVVFAIYSGISLILLQERKIDLWTYICTSLNCETFDESGDTAPLVTYVKQIKPTPSAIKVLSQFFLDLLVLLAIFYIPTIRNRDTNTFSDNNKM